MPQIKKHNSKRIYLKSTINEVDINDRLYVEMKDGFTAQEYLEVIKAQTGYEQALAGITTLTTSWNATDSDNNALPITLENISKLDLKDHQQLSIEFNNVVNGLNKELVSDSEKKVSTSTSTQSIQIEA